MIFAITRRPAAPVAIVALLLVLASCGSVRDADRTLNDAVAGTTALAAYYDDLAAITLDGWQNQSVYNALLGIPPPAGELYNERLRAFRQRAEIAHAMVTVYQRLQALRDPKGVAGVSSAAQDLGKATQSISAVPGLAKLPTDQLGAAAAALVNLQREHDLKQALTMTVSLNRALADMFSNEQGVYESVEADRVSTGVNLIPILADKKLVNPAALLPGLHLGLAVSSGSGEPAQAAGLAMAKIGAERARLAWQCATQQVAHIMLELVNVSDAVRRGVAQDLNSLEQATAHATSCISEQQQLSGGKQ